MNTMLIQLTNQKAVKISFELEELCLIKVLKKNVISDQKLSEKYAGKLSKEFAEDLQKHISESRN